MSLVFAQETLADTDAFNLGIRICQKLTAFQEEGRAPEMSLKKMKAFLK